MVLWIALNQEQHEYACLQDEQLESTMLTDQPSHAVSGFSLFLATAGPDGMRQ